MDWSFLWLPFGGGAFLLVLVAFGRAFRGKRAGWQALLFASLSCGALALLAEYRTVARWVEHGDLAAVCDVAPTMAHHLTAAVLIGLGLNLLLLLLHLSEDRHSSGG